MVIKIATKEEELKKMLYDYEKFMKMGFQTLCKELRRIEKQYEVKK